MISTRSMAPAGNGTNNFLRNSDLNMPPRRLRSQASPTINSLNGFLKIAHAISSTQNASTAEHPWNSPISPEQLRTFAQAKRLTVLEIHIGEGKYETLTAAALLLHQGQSNLTDDAPGGIYIPKQLGARLLILVHPDFQGRRLAGSLLDAAKLVLRPEDRQTISIEVSLEPRSQERISRNKIAFERLGFRLAPSVRGLNGGQNAVMYWRDLPQAYLWPEHIPGV